MFRVKAVSSATDDDDEGEDDKHDHHVHMVSPQVVGNKVVVLEVQSDEVFRWLAHQVASDSATAAEETKEEGDTRGGRGASFLDIKVHPVLMTLGINEMQTVANVAGDTSLQTFVNNKGLQELRKYLDAYRGFVEGSWGIAGAYSRTHHETLIARRGSSEEGSNRDKVVLRQCEEILKTLEGLIDSEASLKQRKTVDLLLESCYIARLLKGARTTSCKSAKDRTSMFYTLELVRLAEKRGMLATLRSMAGERADGYPSGQQRGRPGELGTVQNLLNLLRGTTGVRLQNCKDNIGHACFSFNRVQLQTLPRELQPPPWTIGSAKHS